MRFAKGHGTGNDFVILPDPDGHLPLTPAFVAALCDRRRGIGADGVLRVVRSAAHPDAEASAGAAEWFMDYWNADGSIAEMCGNGVRVFSRYLIANGLATAGPEGLPAGPGLHGDLPVPRRDVGDEVAAVRIREAEALGARGPGADDEAVQLLRREPEEAAGDRAAAADPQGEAVERCPRDVHRPRLGLGEPGGV